MLENLKLAIKRQKRIVLIFFLTIFIPCIILGIFGIIAIRNERFRVAEQLENEHQRAAEYIKSQVEDKFREVGSIIQNIAQSSKNPPSTQFNENQLMEYVFIAHKDEEPFFPQFQPIRVEQTSPVSQFKSPQNAKLERAQAYELKQKNYDMAITLYQELYEQTKDENLKAQILHYTARSQVKKKDFQSSIKNYQRLIKDYEFSISSYMQPLAIISGLQIIQSFRELGDTENALRASLALCSHLVERSWELTEGQLKNYYSLANEAFNEMISETKYKANENEFSREWNQLKVLYDEKIEQWQIIKNIKQEIFPELRKRLTDIPELEATPLFFVQTIDDAPYLIMGARLSDEGSGDFSGLIGAKVNNKYLAENVLQSAINSIQFSVNTHIVISDLVGRPILGKKELAAESATVTEFFENNFPPWKIEFFRYKATGLPGIDLKKNFYFWTIFVLLIVLTFGAILITRTIAHEVEVLKIKSDFVSSVSHELKTPLTSIRTLVERLQSEKVKDRDKMHHYFSIIGQETDKLTRLVGNLLDFSKIEEGKREFEFADTDLAELVSGQIQEFQQDEFRKDVSILIHIQDNIPQISVDRDAIIQALNNVLDNAVKFSSDKKVIEVSLKKDNGKIVLAVKDHGIGIPSDELDKIFDKFYQGKNSQKQTVKGTGLGLILVKHTVEAHGGSVAVESGLGEGSCFFTNFSH